MDTNLTLARKEYFELINFLNTGNNLPNEPTRIYFYIGAGKLFGSLKPSQKVLLCETVTGRWQPYYHGYFFNLKEALTDFLKKKRNENLTLTEEVELFLFQLSN